MKCQQELLPRKICARVKSRYIGDGHPTFNRNPYNGYINPYYWVDEFIPYYMEISWELIDPGTYGRFMEDWVFFRFLELQKWDFSPPASFFQSPLKSYKEPHF